MKNEADPTTIPPAIGAWIMSRIIISPLIKAETMKEAIMEAPMPIIKEIGVFCKLKRLKLFVTSI
jgi:hypothetical protein